MSPIAYKSFGFLPKNGSIQPTRVLGEGLKAQWRREKGYMMEAVAEKGGNA
jgi:hypothetical protein